MRSVGLLDGLHNVLAKVGCVSHREKDAAYPQLRVDLPLDGLNRTDQLRHALGGQIVGLDGDQDLISSGQCVDHQHTKGGSAVQENVIIAGLHAVQQTPITFHSA